MGTIGHLDGPLRRHHADEGHHLGHDRHREDVDLVVLARILQDSDSTQNTVISFYKIYFLYFHILKHLYKRYWRTGLGMTPFTGLSKLEVSYFCH